MAPDDNDEPQHQEDRQREAWFAAAEAGDIATMAHVLTRHPEFINATECPQRMKSFMTALQMCAWRNHSEAAAWLIDVGGADLEVADEFGMTALLINLARVGLELMFPFPLVRSRCIDMSSPIEESETALLLATSDGLTKHVQILIANGADIHTLDAQNRTIFEIACQKGHVDVAQLLLANDNECDWQAGEQALRDAVCHDFPGILDLLLDKVVVIVPEETRTEILGELLHLAVEFDAPECTLHLLLTDGTDVNWRSSTEKGSQTAVHLACRLRRSEILRILLDNGADGNTFCEDGDPGSRYSPYHVATMNRGHEQIDILAEHGIAPILASWLQNLSPLNVPALIHSLFDATNLITNSVSRPSRGNLLLAA
ncbi:Ankyrin repeat domain-containing protein 50, partial [Globisporangium splendens]